MKNVLSILGNVMAIIAVIAIMFAIMTAFTAFGGVWGTVLLLGVIGFIRLCGAGNILEALAYGTEKMLEALAQGVRKIIKIIIYGIVKRIAIALLFLVSAAVILIGFTLGRDALIFLYKKIGTTLDTTLDETLKVTKGIVKILNDSGESIPATESGSITAIFFYIILGWFIAALFCYTARRFNLGGGLKWLDDIARGASTRDVFRGKKLGFIDSFLLSLVWFLVWIVAKIVNTVHILDFSASIVKKICKSYFIENYFVKGTPIGLATIGLLGIVTTLGIVLTIDNQQNLKAVLGDAFFLGALSILMSSAFRFIIGEQSVSNKGNTNVKSKLIKLLLPATTFGLAALSLLVAFFFIHPEVVPEPALNERKAELDKWEDELDKRDHMLFIEGGELRLREGNLAYRERRVEAREKKVEALKKEVAAWRREVAARENALVGKLSSEQGDYPSGELNDIRARLAMVESALGSSQRTLKDPALAEWEARLAEWEAELEEGHAELEEENAQLEKWASELADSQIILSNERMILSNELETLRRYYVALADDNLGPLTEELANLAERLKELTIKVEKPPHESGHKSGNETKNNSQDIEGQILAALQERFGEDTPSCGGKELQFKGSDARHGVRIGFIPEDIQFESGQSDLQENLQEVLKCFFPPFIEVLRGFDIGEIRIEGHTSSEWEKEPERAYLHNMALSHRRTHKVLEYVLDNISEEYGKWLLNFLSAGGWSSTKALNEESNEEDENEKASRRVGFEVRGKAPKPESNSQ